ncbi:unnamed protein product [Aphanomyces euteiches]
MAKITWSVKNCILIPLPIGQLWDFSNFPQDVVGRLPFGHFLDVATRMVVLCRALGQDWTWTNAEACVTDVINVLQTSKQYSDFPPVVSNFVWCFVFATACFLLQVVTGNYSFVDRLWSLSPVFYAWNYIVVAWLRGLEFDVRLVVVVMLITQWGVRLTYNFYRKGGYVLTSEDYRWEFTRLHFIKNWFLWQVFALVFIAFYQNFLLYLITCPLQVVFKVWENKFKSDIYDNWTWLDSGLALAFAGFLILETIADQEQWNFQGNKWKMLKKGKKLQELPYPYSLGFVTTGTFAYSRHPNFFAEQAMWWVVYFFSVSASGYQNWTILGTILLTLLFQGSTRYTEHITLTKYSNYAKYQQAVSMLLPLPPSKNPAPKKD